MLVDVVPRFEKSGSARIRDFMFTNVDGFDTLEQAAEAVSAYLPHRTKPRSPEGLKKNLRLRDGRWYWHWDPAFLTKPEDDPFARVDKLEQAAMNLTIPILLIRGKLSDVVSPEGVQDFLEKVPAVEFVELSDAGHTAAATTTMRSPRSSWSSSGGEPRPRHRRLRRRFCLLCLGQPLVEPLADVLRRIGVAATLIPRHHDATRDDSGDTGQSNPLPDAAHDHSVHKLRR